MLSSQIKFTANRQTPVKQYASDLLMHKEENHCAERATC